MRSVFFGAEASTAGSVGRLKSRLKQRYHHFDLDIRDRSAMMRLFAHYRGTIELVIHTAAQPSHDWAVREPFTDFEINAVGTTNLLEATRLNAPHAPFIFTSTNKVYGDNPNRLPLVELETRYEIEPGHAYANGIREDMSIDQNMHSLFGVSKTSADLMVQEYGRYFGMATACFRGGTLTGPHHAATELHGFLAYLMRSTMERRPYTVFGYKGKQVRDAIHSSDLIAAFMAFFADPRSAEVYNIGGGRFSNTSMIEAIDLCQRITGEALSWTYSDKNRAGDHIWWVGDNGKFAAQYPGWTMRYDVPRILTEIYEGNRETWVPSETPAREMYLVSSSTPSATTEQSPESLMPPVDGDPSPEPPLPFMGS